MIIEDSSLITDSDSDSFLYGASYLPNTGYTSTDSSAGDDLSSQHKIFQVEQTCPRWSKRQGEPMCNPVHFSQLIVPAHQASVPHVMNFKKPRLGIKEEDSMPSHSLQLLSHIQTQNPVQSHNPELPADISQQHLFQNQLQKKSTMLIPNPQSLYIQPLPPNQLSRDPQKQLATLATLKGGMCARIMEYMYHQRCRPPDNNIEYWRKFVKEYYSPHAKKKWCLSKYENVGRHAQGVFYQAAMDAWKCDFCGSTSRKGFEATFEVLPRLCKIYFDSGVVNEFLYLEFPIERQLPSGFMMVVFRKAVQESVYKDFRVVHEGQLRVIFTQELKIISWKFCGERDEEMIPLGIATAQVNELVKNAERCQSNIEAKETIGDPTQDLLTNCNKLAAAQHELARMLEPPLVNKLGFSKQFIRCVQISEVVNCMKELISYSQSNILSPIETLKRYHQEYTSAKLNARHAEGRSQHMQDTQGHECSNVIDTSLTNNPHNHQEYAYAKHNAIHVEGRSQHMQQTQGHDCNNVIDATLTSNPHNHFDVPNLIPQTHIRDQVHPFSGGAPFRPAGSLDLAGLRETCYI